jgi:predicted aminopeptidase
VTIDGCTAVSFYMSDSFAACQIITAKSAAVNLIRPTEDDDVRCLRRAWDARPRSRLLVRC